MRAFTESHTDTDTKSGAIEKTSYSTEVELQSVEDRDTAALARLGKKPILKVLHWSMLEGGDLLRATETIYLLVYAWLYMYHSNHMGG